MGFELESGGTAGKGAEPAAPVAGAPGKHSLAGAHPEETADAAAGAATDAAADAATEKTEPPAAAGPPNGGATGGGDDKPPTLALGGSRGSPSDGSSSDGPVTVGEGGGRPHGAGAPRQAGGVAGRVAGGITIRAFTANGNGSTTRTTRVGVGELLTFTAPSPGGAWTASVAGPIPQGAVQPTNRQYVWRAPAGGGTATITWTPAHGEARTIELQIVEPSSINFHSTGERPMEPHGVGVKGNLQFGPDDVSFAGAGWREQDDGATGDAKNPQGYFRRVWGMGMNLRHHAAPTARDMMRGSEGMGPPPNDTAAVGALPRIDGGYAAGTFHYEIPNKYTVGATEGNFQGQAAISRQEFVMDATGRLTVTKSAGGAAMTASKDAPRDAAGDRAARDALRTAADADANDDLRRTTPEDYRGAFRREGLELLVNRLRSEGDPAIKGYIREAIREHAARMKLAIHCVNSHSWSDPDSITITVNNQYGGSTRLTSGNADEITINFRTAYQSVLTGDFETLPPASINLRARSWVDHDYSFTIDPLTDVTSLVNVPGTTRYQYSYRLEGRGGESGAAADAARRAGSRRR